MAFDDLMSDIVMLVKAGGDRHGPYKSVLTSDKCMINDASLDAEPGDEIVRTLPNGRDEHYIILRADFRQGFGGIPSGYDLALTKRQQILPHKPKETTVNIHNSTGFQVGDYNVQNIQAALLSLERAIDSQDAPDSAKSDAKAKLKALLQHPLVVSVLGGLAGGAAG